MHKQSNLENLNEVLERSIGCKIGIKYIQNDKKGMLKYVPAGSLYRRKPLILSHFVGKLMVILPARDYLELIRGKIAPQKYVDEAIWHYGYFWGGANIKNGVFWETLEGGKPGIHDTKKVQRYLTMMQCRTAQHHLGMEAFDKAQCANCTQKACPMSPILAKNAGASLENEFGDHKMRRAEFYDAVVAFVKERFDFKVSGFFIDEKIPMSIKELYFVPGFSKKSTRVVVSQEMYVDMMYNPEKYDVEEILRTYGLIAATQLYDQKTDKISLGRTMRITPDTTTTQVNKFWYNM